MYIFQPLEYKYTFSPSPPTLTYLLLVKPFSGISQPSHIHSFTHSTLWGPILVECLRPTNHLTLGPFVPCGINNILTCTHPGQPWQPVYILALPQPPRLFIPQVPSVSQCYTPSIFIHSSHMQNKDPHLFSSDHDQGKRLHGISMLQGSKWAMLIQFSFKLLKFHMQIAIICSSAPLHTLAW